MARVCISAGHGLGSRKAGQVDSGAVGSGHEATKTLGMATRLAEDFAVLGIWCLLRDSGYYAQADDDALKAGCNLFVELHFDSASSKSAHGSTGIVGNPSALRERDLARSLSRDVAAAIGPAGRDRGLSVRGDLAVLRSHATMDSVLLEIAFISNPNEMAAFEANVNAVELAILNCILRHYGRPNAKSLPRLWGPWRRALHYLKGRRI